MAVAGRRVVGGANIAAPNPVDRWFGATVAGLVLSAVFMASIPVQIRAAREAGDRCEPPSLGLALVVGTLGCFAPGSWESSRRRRYGSTTICFTGAAPRVGGKLVATVRIERGLGPASRIDCALRCQRRQFTLQTHTEHPDFERTDTPIWEVRFRIDSAEVRFNEEGAEIPIEVDISPLSRPTDWSNWQDQVVWDLVLDSGRGLLDYRARIELPVHPPRGAPG